MEATITADAVTPEQQALGLTDELRQRFIDHPSLGLEVWEKFAANATGPANPFGVADSDDKRPLRKVVSDSFLWTLTNEGEKYWSNIYDRIL